MGKYRVIGGLSMPHMPATGVSGVDLYTTDADGNRLWCAGSYAFGDTIRYHYAGLSYRHPRRGGNEFCLYLPLYNHVEQLEIGVPEGSEFCFLPPRREKPVVVYGTSIAQGACASRPGMAWTNLLHRRLNRPIVNLGFSGQGQLDAELFKLLAEIDAAIYVIDCMPNMTDRRTALIQKRIEQGVTLIREKSDAPILLVEHDGYMGYRTSDALQDRFRKANKELRAAYDRLSTRTDKLYYLTFEELALDMDSQVDGTHTSDIGMQQYTDAYYKKIADILRLKANRRPAAP